MAQLLLGSGYPYEVLISDPKTKTVFSKFLLEDAALIIKRDLKKAVGHIDIDGNLYFWSTVVRVERIEVPSWLDEVIFKIVTDVSQRMSILKEMTRLAAIGRQFRNKEDVAVFLNLLEESQKKL